MCVGQFFVACRVPGLEGQVGRKIAPLHVQHLPTSLLLRDCREVYEAASPGYRGRCTAPLVIDKLQRRLVSNESADILRMLNSMQLPGASNVDLYPAEHRAEIDAVNDLVYDKVCSGAGAA